MAVKRAEKKQHPKEMGEMRLMVVAAQQITTTKKSLNSYSKMVSCSMIHVSV